MTVPEAKDGLRSGRGVLVVVPTYEERETLPALLEGLARHVPDAGVVVIDDGSPDGTGLVAEQIAAERPGVSVVHREGKQGFASALLAGIRLAVDADHEVVVQMDADLSHDPADLPAILAALERADLVLGSRYAPGGRTPGWAWHRLALSRGANLYAGTVLGVPARDITTGYRAMRVELARRLLERGIRSEGFGFQIETAYRAQQAGRRIAEVPITFGERAAGRSKLSRSIVVEAFFRVLALRLGGSERRSQATPP